MLDRYSNSHPGRKSPVSHGNGLGLLCLLGLFQYLSRSREYIPLRSGGSGG